MPFIDAIKLASQSLRLDCELLRCTYPKTPGGKLEFITKKYLALGKHFLLRTPAKPGTSKVRIGNHWIYYDSVFGISTLQAMVVNIHRHFLRYIMHLSRPTIIDVGAYIGIFSLTMSHLFEHSRIYAIEPLNQTFKLLKKNTQNIKNITPVHLGLSNKRSKARIYFSKTLLMYSSLFPERFTWNKRPSTELVDLMRLDDFIKEHNIDHIDILKIDAEGSEEKILKGARNALARTHYLLLECSLDQLNGTTFSSIMKTLYGPKHNFQLMNIGNTLYTPKAELVTIDFLLKNLRFDSRTDKKR